MRRCALEHHWLVAEKKGKWVSLFVAHWKPELGVWHAEKPVVELWTGDLAVLQSVLESAVESVVS